MSRQAASILVIAPFKDDERMYPHLHDILVNLRQHYDEVIYYGDDPQFFDHFKIDCLINNYLKTGDRNEQATLQATINANIIDFKKNRALYADRLRAISFRNRDFLVLAVDDNAFNVAIEVFPDNTIYWSFDPLGKDCPHRLDVDGFVEQLLRENASKSSCAKALIVQDVSREQHLKYCFDAKFRKTIYLPVSLSDTRFCALEALKRGQGYGRQRTIKIVQSGHICAVRYSIDIARSLQGWSDNVEMYFRGNLSAEFVKAVENLARPVHYSGEFYENRVLPTIFSGYDVGFIGHRETDLNHYLVVNASSQLVAYLRLGMPVICCGSELLVSFVKKNKIGLAANHPSEIKPEHILDLIENFSSYSRNARKLFEEKYDLNHHMNRVLYPELDFILKLV